MNSQQSTGSNGSKKPNLKNFVETLFDLGPFKNKAKIEGSPNDLKTSERLLTVFVN